MSVERHPESLKSLIHNRLTAAGFRILEVTYESLHQLAELPLDLVDAVLMAPARHFPKEHLNRLSRCRLIQIWSSGYDKFNMADAQQRGIPVANNHGANAISVAEHTILMMLGISRRVPEMHERVLSGKWAGNDHGMSSFSLNGKTLGIVGLGNIGRLVATRAEALGMKIRFTDPHVDIAPTTSWIKSSFSELLVAADYLSFHVHLTESTRNMLNDSNIRTLERQPFIINVSRAELINRHALTRALAEGLIKGVAIDAHYDEPTNPNDDLWQFPNILVSPHVAGSTLDSYGETINACILNIAKAIRGQTPLGLVTSATGDQPSHGISF